MTEDAEGGGPRVRQSRWPMALAVIVAGVLLAAAIAFAGYKVSDEMAQNREVAAYRACVEAAKAANPIYPQVKRNTQATYGPYVPEVQFTGQSELDTAIAECD